MLYDGRIIWHGPVERHRPVRRRHGRPVHPRPRRRSDPDGDPGLTLGHRWRETAMPNRFVCQSAAPASRSGPAAAKPAAAGTRWSRRRRATAEAAARDQGQARAEARLRAAGRRIARRWRGGQTGIAEFDRVCGGGLVPGSALLIGGDPGIGKSTLLLQVAAALRRHAAAASTSPARKRSTRCGCAPSGWASRDAPVQLAAATSVRDIVATLERPDAPEVVVIDSIQTMWVDALESAPGTVAQVRASAQALIRLAKRRGFVLLLVGHVTKEGRSPARACSSTWSTPCSTSRASAATSSASCARSRTASAPTDEIGVFEMTDARPARGRQPVGAVPRRARRRRQPGAAVFAGIEGTRPLLVEIQALVAPSRARHAAPRRGRLGRQPAGDDAGGAGGALRRWRSAPRRLSQRRRRPADQRAGGRPGGGGGAGLGVAAARPLPPDTVVFGEIGLAGEVRAGRPARGAAEGSGEARLPRGGGAGAAAGRRQARRPVSFTRSAHAADLLARVQRRRPQRAPRAEGRACLSLPLTAVDIGDRRRPVALGPGGLRPRLRARGAVGRGLDRRGGGGRVRHAVRPAVRARHSSQPPLLADVAAGAVRLPRRADRALDADPRRSRGGSSDSALGAIDRSLGFVFGAGARRGARLPRLPADRLADAAGRAAAVAAARRAACRWSSRGPTAIRVAGQRDDRRRAVDPSQERRRRKLETDRMARDIMQSRTARLRRRSAIAQAEGLHRKRAATNWSACSKGIADGRDAMAAQANRLRRRRSAYDDDHLHEECGVFGIFGDADAAAHTALGLHALQHRGQEAAGIVTFDGEHFHAHRRSGWSATTSATRRGHRPAARQRSRSATSATPPPARRVLRNVQPLFADFEFGGLAIAHNGNLTNALALRQRAGASAAAIFQSTTDTEVIIHLIATSQYSTVVDRLIDALRQVEGAYSLVALTRRKLIGVRDPSASARWCSAGSTAPGSSPRRPARSTSSARDFVRDVEPGEIVVIDDAGPALDQAVRQGAHAASASSSTSTSPGPTRRSRAAASTRSASASAPSSPAKAASKPTSSCRCPTPACRRRSATPRRPACRSSSASSATTMSAAPSSSRPSTSASSASGSSTTPTARCSRASASSWSTIRSCAAPPR